MLEPDKNPNSSWMVDPPALVRRAMRHIVARVIDPAQRQKRRDQAEATRQKTGAPHEVHYFHQLDDPYCALTAQVLARFAERYDIGLKPHLVRAAGGADQPYLDKLAVWSHRDVALIAPHYGLTFPASAPVTPDPALQMKAAQRLAGLSDADFIAQVGEVTAALWAQDEAVLSAGAAVNDAEAGAALENGAALLKDMNHYSGGTFFYGGEWCWGVDRLFYLEQRLRDLGACRVPNDPYLVPRPDIDVSGVDASKLTLDFYPSLNSPYTSIIFDRTIDMATECGIQLNHNPVLPMIMRGVPATRAKGQYIMFDTKREGEFLGVPFGPVWTPIGTPVRNVYSLLPWAKEQGKDIALLSATLKCSFSGNTPLHQTRGLRKAIEMAGLDWTEAQQHLGDPAWKAMVEQHQDDMVDGLGLWGVPSFKLSGPDGEPDVAVWGQDRLWVIAAEIRRRAGT